MTCYMHEQNEAIGTCVGCGKFICKECTTEVSGKNYCKKCLEGLLTEKDKKIDSLEAKTSQPMVFMNAGGASSSSSFSSGGGILRDINVNIGNSNNNSTMSGVRYVCTKSKVAAGILAIFLGDLGVHKFYLGRTGMGIVYLLFFWTGIPAIVGLIEGIIILTTSDEMFNMKYGQPVAIVNNG